MAALVAPGPRAGTIVFYRTPDGVLWALARPARRLSWRATGMPSGVASVSARGGAGSGRVLPRSMVRLALAALVLAGATHVFGPELRAWWKMQDEENRIVGRQPDMWRRDVGS